MLSILAMLSDIPWYLAELISKITGTDPSTFLDFFSNTYAELMEAINTVFG